MIGIFLFILALIFTFRTATSRKVRDFPGFSEIFLGYILFFNMGIMGLLAAYGHVFMGPEIAKLIGWQPGSPFQYEIGMANLSYGVLGILAFWIRGRFWDACIIGWSVLLLGCFVGHVIDYFVNHNTAPLNIGLFIWFYDLVLPLFVLILLAYFRRQAVNESNVEK